MATHTYDCARGRHKEQPQCRQPARDERYAHGDGLPHAVMVPSGDAVAVQLAGYEFSNPLIRDEQRPDRDERPHSVRGERHAGDGIRPMTAVPARRVPFRVVAMLDVPRRSADSSRVDSHRSVSARMIVGVATVLGIFSALQAYNYTSLFMERAPKFWHLLSLNMTYWYAWALLVPGILWLARRHRFDRATWRRAAAVHACGVMVFVLVHAVITVTARDWLAGLFGFRLDSWWAEFRRLFFLYFDWEMMTYWAVVGLSHALDYHGQAQERALTAAHLETRLAEAQLQALQRQLHPHFLFNTLHTISALMHRDTEEADAMLARLSDLLRLTLDRIGVQQVTLKEELEFLEKYLEIERTRFGDRLVVDMQIEPETLDVSVPNLVLQPLVENAIRHGIATRVGGGRLQIVARRTGNRLWMMVRDNGPGLSKAKLDAFNAGVGVSNTRSRLQHLYPHAHRFEFHEPSDGGLAVTIEIPATPDTDESRHPAVPNMESVA
jgi:two-component system LytT family sensor kinase